jgi:hypothetical protein
VLLARCLSIICYWCAAINDLVHIYFLTPSPPLKQAPKGVRFKVVCDSTAELPIKFIQTSTTNFDAKEWESWWYPRATGIAIVDMLWNGKERSKDYPIMATRDFFYKRLYNPKFTELQFYNHISEVAKKLEKCRLTLLRVISGSDEPATALQAATRNSIVPRIYPIGNIPDGKFRIFGTAWPLDDRAPLSTLCVLNGHTLVKMTLAQARGHKLLAHLVLQAEEQGTRVPLGADFGRHPQLGSVMHGITGLSAAAGCWVNLFHYLHEGFGESGRDTSEWLTKDIAVTALFLADILHLPMTIRELKPEELEESEIPETAVPAADGCVHTHTRTHTHSNMDTHSAVGINTRARALNHARLHSHSHTHHRSDIFS